jgi:F420-non-reducing hydrogenase iron-sulfur subunit
MSTRRATVFCCQRANLNGRSLPEGVRLVDLPCVGRVSTPLILWALAGHADGVLILGRHQATCRFEGAEDATAARVGRVRQLLELVGLPAGQQRLAFVEPAPGPAGPLQAVADFVAAVEPSPLSSAPAPTALLEGEGLDSSLALLRWIAERSGRPWAGAGSWLAASHLTPARPHRPALLAGELPLLALLDEQLLRPVELTGQLTAALDLLGRLGIADAGVLLGPPKSDAGELLALEPTAGAPDAALVDALLARQGDALARAPERSRVACDGSQAQLELLAALGYEPVDAGPDPLPQRFTLSPELRRQAEQRLARAEAQGARALLVDGPAALARWAMLTRDGTWRSSALRPTLGVGLARLAAAGIPLPPPGAREVAR